MAHAKANCKLRPVQKEESLKVKPFSFYERDLQRLAKKEERIRKIQEAEKAAANSFKATPILERDPHKTLQPKRPCQVTAVEPFHFHYKERESGKSGRQEENEEKKYLPFKANTNYKKALCGSGWRPERKRKCTEKFDEFALHTNSRASQRKEFDEHLKRKQALQIALMKERKLQEELRGQEKAEEMRKKAEFKAAPVRKYKQFEVKESDKVLTNPQSPNFSKKPFSERNMGP